MPIFCFLDPLLRVVVNFTVKIAVCMSLRLAAHEEVNCEFDFDSQEGSCSNEGPIVPWHNTRRFRCPDPVSALCTCTRLLISVNTCAEMRVAALFVSTTAHEHVLARVPQYIGDWRCDECNRHYSDQLRFRCTNDCDYDQCITCILVCLFVV